MSTNRPRAKSHSNAKFSSLSVSSPVIRPIIPTVKEEDRSASEGANSSPQIIKVIHPPKTPTIKSKVKVESSEDFDSIDSNLQDDDQDGSKEIDEMVLSSSPVKFNLFSPRKKHSPRPQSTSGSSPRNSSPRPSSKNSSPRSNAGATSSRDSSPRVLRTSHSPNSSPRLSDSADFLALGDSPIDKRDATFIYEAAKRRMASPENENSKNIGLLYKHIGKNRYGTRTEYDVLVTGANETGLGSLIFFIDKTIKLGEGASAYVYLSFDAQIGEKYAVKEFKPSASYKMINAEVQALMALDLFYGGFNLGKTAQDVRIIVTKYYPGKSLLNALYEILQGDNDQINYPNKKSYPFQLMSQMIIGVMNALAKVHEKNYIHRDVKLANFLCHINSGKVEINLCDFDSAISADVKTAKIASSFGYMAPEHAADDLVNYSFASDYFSVGVVIWEIISPINFQQKLNQLYAKIKEEEKWDRHLTRKEFLELMVDLTENNKLDINPCNISDYIYHTKIESHLYSLVSLLVQENPAARLKGTTLRDEINRVIYLSKLHEDLSSGLTSLLLGIDGLQRLGIPLALLKSLTEKKASLSNKDLLSIATAALEQTNTAYTNAERCIDVSIKQITEALEALKTFISGFSMLQNYKDEINLLFLQPIVKANTQNPKEAMTLLEEVLMLKPVPSYLTPQI